MDVWECAKENGVHNVVSRSAVTVIGYTAVFI